MHPFTNPRHSSDAAAQKRALIQQLQSSFYPGALPEWACADQEVMLACFSRNPSLYAQFIPSLRLNQTIVLKGIRMNPYLIQYLPEELRDNERIGHEVVSIKGYLLLYLSDRLRDDLTTVETAMDEFSNALACASDRLRSNPDLAIKLLQASASYYTSIHPDLLFSHAFLDRCFAEGVDIEPIAEDFLTFDRYLLNYLRDRTPHIQPTPWTIRITQEPPSAPSKTRTP